MENFNRPYFAKSIADFWSKWHISLSTWFKDYVYIPLGGNRTSQHRWYLNLFIVFILSGLWHGANWTFIVWGALHGTYLVMGNVVKKLTFLSQIRAKLSKTAIGNTVNVSLTFILVTLAWVFFRANSLTQALGILKGFLIYKPGFFIGQPNYFFYSIMALLALWLYEYSLEFKWRKVNFAEMNLSFRMLSYGLLIFTIILFGVFDGSQFIYFQF